MYSEIFSSRRGIQDSSCSPAFRNVSILSKLNQGRDSRCLQFTLKRGKQQAEPCPKITQSGPLRLSIPINDFPGFPKPVEHQVMCRGNISNVLSLKNAEVKPFNPQFLRIPEAC